MKKLIGALTIAMLASTAAMAERIAVHVFSDAGKQTFRGIERDSTTVCALKAHIAGQLGIDPRKFDLKEGSRTLPGNETLRDAGVSANNNLTVAKRNSNSRQC